ncbi:MAG: hypothetical protein J6K84_05915 [Oscillospiraceae bacterium]|nr:hypothetical protein [Oscillospiraceae bacterium]
MKKWICILLIVTLCFTGLALGFTYGLIEKHSAPPVSGEDDVPPPVQRGDGIDLYGTFDENDLVYTDEKATYKGLEITIPQISGLKDKAVEDAINSQMRESIYTALDSAEGASYASGSLMANFGNVLSIQYHISCPPNGAKRLFFNYNLVTGEPLHVTDLFYEDTDLLTLVRESFYDSLSLNLWDYGNAVSPDENLLYRTVKNFMDAENPEFCFSSARVQFYSGDYSAQVDFITIPTEVAIYERFLTENSIFAEDGIGFDNIFTCANSTSYHAMHYIDFGQKGENLWYDVTMMGTWLPDGISLADKVLLDAFEDSLFDEVYAEITRYETIAKENPDKFYILLAKPAYFVVERSQFVDNAWVHDASNAVGSSWNMDIYEIPMDLYESEYKDKLIASYRYSYFFMAGGAYIDRYEEEGNPEIYTRIATERLVNYRTGEEYTLENIFREGADWQFEVRNEIIDRLANGWSSVSYPMNQAIQLAQTATFRLDGANIRCYIESIPEFDLWYNLSVFPKDMVRIYD